MNLEFLIPTSGFPLSSSYVFLHHLSWFTLSPNPCPMFLSHMLSQLFILLSAFHETFKNCALEAWFWYAISSSNSFTAHKIDIRSNSCFRKLMLRGFNCHLTSGSCKIEGPDLLTPGFSQSCNPLADKGIDCMKQINSCLYVALYRIEGLM